MVEIQCAPVWDKTALRGQTMYLTLHSDGPLPQRLRATFQPEAALSKRELEVLRSSRDDHQFVVVLDPPGPGQLVFTDDGSDVTGSLGLTATDLAIVRHEWGAPNGNGDALQAAAGRRSDIRRIVTLERTSAEPVAGEALWRAIRRSSEALSFSQFSKFVSLAFSSDPKAALDTKILGTVYDELDKRYLFRVDAHERLRVVADVFVTVYGGVRQDIKDGVGSISDDFQAYLGDSNTLPYLQVIYDRLGTKAPSLKDDVHFTERVNHCIELLDRKAQLPCLIELIWSYWHEEGMLAQGMAAIAQRFQNRRALGARDPLAQLEIDPLRPLNHLLWRHVQTEGDRLSVLRRAHEYEAEYGFPLHGKAVALLRAADRRSKFLEAFHNLLYRCVQFYREDDDTTHVADGFPVLNALKETHYVLSQGAHNQFGDLPATARQEMLVEQWLLARPEMRDFLGGRSMVAYPEPWMDRVDTLKTMKGWTDVSVVHFHDLAVFGEQLLLSIRWDHWSAQTNPDYGKQWAREWRPEVQGYIHALRAVLGIDLAAEMTSGRDEADRYLPPAVHLRRRLTAQAGAR